MDTGSRMTLSEYAALAERSIAVDHLRMSVDGLFDGHLVRFSVECGPEMRPRAMRWLERQRRVNHLEAEVCTEEVITIDTAGTTWDERYKGGAGADKDGEDKG